MNARCALVALLAVGAATMPSAVAAQAAAPRVFRVGMLCSESVAYDAPRVATLKEGLRARGYAEGRNVEFVIRYAEGGYARLPGLAAELVRIPADVIVTSGSKAGLAARDATATIPVVVSNMGDAVRPGFVADYARPGGNVTGMSQQNPETATKQLDLLLEVRPGIRRVAVLRNPANPNAGLSVEALSREGAKRGIAIAAVDVRNADELAPRFGNSLRTGFDALVVLSDTMTGAHAPMIAKLALEHRIPSSGTVHYARAGGLVGYSTDRTEEWKRMAGLVDRILKGTKPTDLPVEQPQEFDVVVNLKTAQALGLAPPSVLLLQATEVIR